MALKRIIATPNLLNKVLHPTCSPARAVIPSSTRFFSDSSSTQMSNLDQNERGIDIDRRSSDSLSRRRDTHPTLFSDVFDPFSPSRSLSSLFNMMDNFMDSPFTNPRGGLGSVGGLRRGWDAREDENSLYLKIDMPGLSKEEVNVSVDQNTLTIKGEGGKETEDEESVRRYSSRIDLPSKIYKLDQIKAEMKNGVLKVIVPKVKEEERSDVVQVNVE
ncbi:hypothetical protein MKW94_009824 [Papaver nudicaule]|uniref:SHSP domain-containing protein n=1 Tax=Papaver nudicaule TaxID=74823 RepID=A0AA42APS4_PAPNU|nr:hypothetical protein [Papaver nudicaule]